MARQVISAAALILTLAATHAQAEQPDSFNPAQANQGKMVSCSGNQRFDNPQHSVADKSERLSSPYYQTNRGL